MLVPLKRGRRFQLYIYMYIWLISRTPVSKNQLLQNMCFLTQGQIYMAQQVSFKLLLDIYCFLTTYDRKFLLETKDMKTCFIDIELGKWVATQSVCEPHSQSVMNSFEQKCRMSVRASLYKRVFYETPYAWDMHFIWALWYGKCPRSFEFLDTSTSPGGSEIHSIEWSPRLIWILTSYSDLAFLLSLRWPFFIGGIWDIPS